MRSSLRPFPAVWRERRKVQSERVVSSLDIAKLLVFDPRKALRHAPHFNREAAARGGRASGRKRCVIGGEHLLNVADGKDAPGFHEGSLGAGLTQ